jgi:hypothetical protein
MNSAAVKTKVLPKKKDFNIVVENNCIETYGSSDCLEGVGIGSLMLGGTVMTVLDVLKRMYLHRPFSTPI